MWYFQGLFYFEISILNDVKINLNFKKLKKIKNIIITYYTNNDVSNYIKSRMDLFLDFEKIHNFQIWFGGQSGLRFKFWVLTR
jgi:hypothetical protein